MFIHTFYTHIRAATREDPFFPEPEVYQFDGRLILRHKRHNDLWMPGALEDPTNKAIDSGKSNRILKETIEQADLIAKTTFIS